MVVELQPLIVIVGLEVAVDGTRSLGLGHCRGDIVAAEALAVHIVVVVLAVVRHTESA